MRASSLTLNLYFFMKIKILKRIIICGKIANVGDVVDSESIPARDYSYLLKEKLAEKYDTKKSTETADAVPVVETADAGPKRGKGKNK